jgi:hypothetical protein
MESERTAAEGETKGERQSSDDMERATRAGTEIEYWEKGKGTNRRNRDGSRGQAGKMKKYHSRYERREMIENAAERE